MSGLQKLLRRYDMDATHEWKRTDRIFNITFYADASFRIPKEVDEHLFVEENWVKLQDEAIKNMREYCDFDLYEIS